MTTTPKPNEQRSERRSRLVVTQDKQHFTLRLRDIQALDHSDIFLIKEWMSRNDTSIKVTINLKDVQYLPTGFFGMLHEVADLGVNLSLSNLAAPIKQHLWVKQFIADNGDFVIPTKAWVPTRD